MLIDSVVTNKDKPFTKERTIEIRQFLNKAMRYVFDLKGSKRLARFATNEIDVVCEHAWMATTPYPNTYLEIDARAAALELGQDTYGMPDKTGYFFTEDGCVYIVYGDDKEAIVTPFTYAHKSFGMNFNAWMLNPNEQRLWNRDHPNDSLQDVHQAFKTYLMVGIAGDLERLNKDGYAEARRWAHMITDLYDVGVARPVDFVSLDVQRKILMEQVNECAGGLRRALAALLLLGERKHTVLIRNSASSKIVKGKHFAVPAHNIVTIDLDKEHFSYRSIFAAQSGTHQKWHTVEGHWYHFNISKQCQHSWKPFHSESLEKKDMEAHGHILTRHICEFCGGTRTRKIDFSKGDLRLGKVEKQYRVTASKETVSRKQKVQSKVKDLDEGINRDSH